MALLIIVGSLFHVVDNKFYGSGQCGFQQVLRVVQDAVEIKFGKGKCTVVNLKRDDMSKAERRSSSSREAPLDIWLLGSSTLTCEKDTLL